MSEYEYTCKNCDTKYRQQCYPYVCYCGSSDFDVVSLNEVPNTPTFTRLADITLDRCVDTYSTRGAQYADDWKARPNFALSAVAQKLGYNINPAHLRAITAAVLVDVKYSRLMGGYKDDSIIDGINYAAVLAQEMREIEAREGGE